MKLVLFVEGHTEKMALPSFLKRWLDPKLPQPIGIKTVRFEGWRDYYDEIARGGVFATSVRGAEHRRRARTRAVRGPTTWSPPGNESEDCPNQGGNPMGQWRDCLDRSGNATWQWKDCRNRNGNAPRAVEGLPESKRQCASGSGRTARLRGLV